MENSIYLQVLAEKIGAHLEGGAHNLCVSGIATLMRASQREISFFTNGSYRDELKNTRAAAVILAAKDSRYCQVPKLIMDNPYLGYARAAALFTPVQPRTEGIHPSAWVSPQAQLATNVSVGPQAVIEAGAQLGADVIVGPGCVISAGVIIDEQCHLIANVTVCSGTRMGKRVLIHPGAVIGSDGFGLANDEGKWVKIPQLGGVVIADDVEIGANTTIDKGALEDTFIDQGVKLDNQIQIGHNVQIGAYTAIAGCVGIAGSTRIGRYCMIAGGVGIVGHIELVDNVHVTGGSIVLQSITEPGTYSSGTPLEPNRRWRRTYHRLKKLDEMARHLQHLEQTIK